MNRKAVTAFMTDLTAEAKKAFGRNSVKFAPLRNRIEFKQTKKLEKAFRLAARPCPKSGDLILTIPELSDNKFMVFTGALALALPGTFQANTEFRQISFREIPAHLSEKIAQSLQIAMLS